ncbi:MAG: hypothetical protein GPOALKHO_000851 [Sodalis sp.]|nr:MAG: hypothetical protein GPOALKHO_000851 [Sodalis sp.]
MAAVLSAILLEDESDYEGRRVKTKLAAIEAKWNTAPAPASFTTLFFLVRPAKLGKTNQPFNGTDPLAFIFSSLTVACIILIMGIALFPLIMPRAQRPTPA